LGWPAPSDGVSEGGLKKRRSARSRRERKREDERWVMIGGDHM